MEPTGLIFAALDCDLDAIEAWNRWYDLEHTPMNVCLDGVMLSRRYVATPRLHELRIAVPGSPFDGGRSTFLTTYVLAGDPQVAFADMSEELPRLYDEGRMTFPAAKKAVREGDILSGEHAQGRPGLQLRRRDVPFVSHDGVVVVQHQDPDGRLAAVVELEGVAGAWRLQSRRRPGTYVDMYFVEGDPGEAALAIRAGAPHRGEVMVDAPYLLIHPLHYPWAEELRSSDLLATVA